MSFSILLTFSFVSVFFNHLLFSFFVRFWIPESEIKMFKMLGQLKDCEEMFMRYDNHVNQKMINALKKVKTLIMQQIDMVVEAKVNAKLSEVN